MWNPPIGAQADCELRVVHGLDGWQNRVEDIFYWQPDYIRKTSKT